MATADQSVLHGFARMNMLLHCIASLPQLLRLLLWLLLLLRWR